MMASTFLVLAGLATAATYSNGTMQNSTKLLTDIDVISEYWGQISPYRDNTENYFGVNYTGLPTGCQVEQAHLLQRHAQRFPTGGETDGT